MSFTPPFTSSSLSLSPLLHSPFYPSFTLLFTPPSLPLLPLHHSPFYHSITIPFNPPLLLPFNPPLLLLLTPPSLSELKLYLPREVALKKVEKPDQVIISFNPQLPCIASIIQKHLRTHGPGFLDEGGFSKSTYGYL